MRHGHVTLRLLAMPRGRRETHPFSPLPNATPPTALAAVQRLHESSFGLARYVPTGSDAVLGAIFTWWNVLDALMSVHSRIRWQTGYVRELQVRRMSSLAREPGVQHYCEVGMNGGHSVVSMLLSNPNLTAHVFDPLEYKYSEPVAQLLRASFGARFQLAPGFSRQTLPPFIRSFTNNGSCATTLARPDPCVCARRARRSASAVPELMLSRRRPLCRASPRPQDLRRPARGR